MQRAARDLNVGDMIVAPDGSHIRIATRRPSDDVLMGSDELKTAVALEFTFEDGQTLMAHPGLMIDVA
jgi:hypothetical protein